MATPENFQNIYHMDKEGNVIINREGDPIELTKSLKEFQGIIYNSPRNPMVLKEYKEQTIHI